jgi:hypothetical protein
MRRPQRPFSASAENGSELLPEAADGVDVSECTHPGTPLGLREHATNVSYGSLQT